jgi:hypothetical protein
MVCLISSRVRARGGHLLKTVLCNRPGPGTHSRWYDRRLVVQQQRGVENGSDMPELKEDVAAYVMDRIDDLRPRRNMLGKVDARPMAEIWVASVMIRPGATT